MTEGQPLNMFVCLIWSVPPDLLYASLNSPPCVVTPVSLAHSPYAQHTLFKLSGPADPPLTPPLVDYYWLGTRSDWALADMLPLLGTFLLRMSPFSLLLSQHLLFEGMIRSVQVHCFDITVHLFEIRKKLAVSHEEGGCSVFNDTKTRQYYSPNDGI